ncbi:MAG: class I SAM-dependent methyltransferase [Zoogloeaceae bacterium]|nr:class I SAM-dependent methyltransferase [Zoogloeaceae bacterium]
MNDDEIKTLFDQQAAVYDQRWERTAPIREALHFLLESVFGDLPADARVLCVGAGTGAEVLHLASRFPGWTFTAVEPAGAMLAVFRAKAEAAGIAHRCVFHEGFLDSLTDARPFDAATCFLVSQFILDRSARIGFFGGIAARLKPGGVLASSDLSADMRAREYDAQLAVWCRMMSGAGISPEAVEQMRAAYQTDVAVLPPAETAALIAAGGFDAPVPFYQAGLIHAWSALRSRIE